MKVIFITQMVNHLINVEKNLQKLAQVFQNYEDKCKMLGIPTIMEIYEHEHSRNKKNCCFFKKKDIYNKI